MGAWMRVLGWGASWCPSLLPRRPHRPERSCRSRSHRRRSTSSSLSREGRCTRCHRPDARPPPAMPPPPLPQVPPPAAPPPLAPQLLPHVPPPLAPQLLPDVPPPAAPHTVFSAATLAQVAAIKAAVLPVPRAPRAQVAAIAAAVLPVLRAPRDAAADASASTRAPSLLLPTTTHRLDSQLRSMEWPRPLRVRLVALLTFGSVVLALGHLRFQPRAASRQQLPDLRGLSESRRSRRASPTPAHRAALLR